MNKMAMLMQMFNVFDSNSYFTIAIENKKCNEIELVYIPPTNILNKIYYYNDIFSEELEMENNSNIKIVAYAYGKDIQEATVNIQHKLEKLC